MLIQRGLFSLNMKSLFYLKLENTGGMKMTGVRKPRRDFRVQASASVQASGFRLQASGFRLQASGFRLQASGFRLQASGFRLQASGFRLQALGFKL